MQQIDNWLSGRVLPCVKGVRTLVGIDTWLGHVGRRLQVCGHRGQLETVIHYT